MKINNIPVTSDTILKCYRMFYPDYYNRVFLANKFHYLDLWGIRLATCDTSMPDDIMGGIRVNNFNFYETIVTPASVDPSPSWLKNPMSSARALGGTAFVVEGQYIYRYMGTRHGRFAPFPSWCPRRAMAVYRWTPTSAEIAASKKGTPLSSFFDAALKAGRVKRSTSPDTCIHRSWSDKNFQADSAGCQIIPDRKQLNSLGDWSKSHISKYGNNITYTLFTKEQFLKANAEQVPVINNLWNWLIPNK